LLQSFLSEVGGRHAEALTETVAEIGVAAETALGGYLNNTPVGLFDEQVGGIVQTQLLNIAVQLGMFTAFGENGTDALLRQLEAVHDGLTPELGVEEEFFAYDNLVDVLEELFVGLDVCVGDNGRLLGPFLLPVHLLVVHRFSNLLGQQAVVAADNPVLDDDDGGKGSHSYQHNNDNQADGLVHVLDALLAVALEEYVLAHRHMSHGVVVVVARLLGQVQLLL